jgi:hypothetical protein
MDIHDFMSPDIAEHCKKIGHVFNPLEMAVIVEYSERPFKEKLAAWQHIIDTCPDIPIRGNAHRYIGGEPSFDARDSLHDFLGGYIKAQKDRFDDFNGGAGAVWRSEKKKKKGWPDDYLVGTFSTADLALTAALEELKELTDDDDLDKSEDDGEIVSIRIKKVIIDKRDGERASAEFDLKGVLIGIDYCQIDPPERLDSIFIHIPVPFERGDVVMEGNNGPLLLTALPVWSTGSDDGSYERYLSGEFGDGSDQCGYALQFYPDGHLEHDHPCTHRLRYFKGELKGREKFLEEFGKYLKVRDRFKDGWQEMQLINAFLKFVAMEEKEDADGRFYDEAFKQ